MVRQLAQNSNSSQIPLEKTVRKIRCQCIIYLPLPKAKLLREIRIRIENNVVLNICFGGCKKSIPSERNHKLQVFTSV